jgi:hypothetical protein
MATIAEIRKKYPQYSDLSDRQLADSLRTKFYSDIPEDEFLNRVGLGETSFLRDVGGAAIRGAGQIVSLPGQLAGLVTGDMDNISTRAGRSVEEFGEELQTEAFRELQRQQAARVEEAGKEGFLSGFGQQAKELLTDPLSLAAGIAQTAPAMIGTGGAGLAGRALAGRLIGREAAKRGALAGAATGEAAIVGGDAAQATYDRVSQMPQEVVARSDAYQAAIAEGATPAEARNAAAISAARRAAAIAAPIAGATGPLGLEAALLTGGLRRGVIRGGAEGAIREGGTEIVQETGQGVAENIGAQAIDPNVALTEDLGGRAAAGLILGGTMGGGAGAISGLRGPEVLPPVSGTFETEIGGQPARATVTQDGDVVTIDYGNGNVATVNRDAWDTYVSGGTFMPTTEPPPPAAGPEVEPEPETGVPATPFGAPPVSEPPPVRPAGETVTIEDDEVTIEYPDGRIETIPRADWDARQKAAAAPVETPTAEPVTEPAAEPVVEPVTEPVIEPTVAEPTAEPSDAAVIRPDDVFRGSGIPKITVEQTDKPFVVRATKQDQIDDMIASGLVRPKPGGYGKQQKQPPPQQPPPQQPPPQQPPPQQPPPQQPAPSPPPPITPTKETRGEAWSRKIVDRFERLRVVQNLGQLRAGIEGFYEAARKFDSRAGELMAKFNRDYFQPIEKIMKEAGLSLETVDAYLYARAAQARNARLKAKAENEIRTKMYNKIISEMEADGATEAEIQTAIIDADADVQAAIAKAEADGKIPESGSGMTDQEAADIMNDFRGQDYFPALERIGEIFNRANKERMENNIQRGLVSREIGEQLLRDEPNYVPMKGFEFDENLNEPVEGFEDVMGYGGSGFGVSVREWYDTRGRTSIGFSPLSTFVSDVGTSIVRGERNRVGQKLMTFFIDNPSESWKVFSYRNPPRNRNGDIQRPSPFDPNFMVVKRGGETFYLRIDDPLLAKAAKNLNPQQMNSLLQISSNLTRMLSRSFTTANPDFFVPNVFRDLQSAALNLGAEAPGLLKAFRKNVTNRDAFKTIAAFEYGRPIKNKAMGQRYEQFKLDGGSVSWVQRDTPQEHAAKIQNNLKTVNDSLRNLKDNRTAKNAIDVVWNPTSKGFRAMVGALESTNAIFENGIRFAAYNAALDVGMSRDQAAMISREATVDFNRRGEAGALLNALYAFFNAGIQGSVRTARALSNNPLKTGKLSTTQAALLGMMTTAATLAAANAALSDEDDDGKLFWDKIPDYEKQRNLIIMNPLDGKTYTKIPMPYGFGFFPYLATRTMDAARRGDDLGAVGLDITTAGLGNFSPVQFGAGNIPSSVARAVTPTMGKPFVELMLNENYMGKPIYNEPFDKGQSYASVARFNTWDGYKELSQFLNDISGGEGKLKGNLNAPAESFEYLTEFSLGGVTNLAKSLYRTGEEGDAVAAPVLRRLIGQPGKGRNVGEYYEREERARVVNQQMKDLTGLERRALIEKFPAETNPRVQSALTSARSAVRKLNEERKRIRNLDIDEGVKAERLEALRERTDAEFVRFNRIYNQVEQATR